MQVTGLQRCLADSYREQSEAYRESIGHLLLPVHRFEKPQVADYPSWGQGEDRGVVIQGNLHHGVFRLPTERYTKRNALLWRHVCFIIIFQDRSCGAEKTYQTLHFRAEKVIFWEVSHMSSENTGEGAEDGTRNQCLF